MKLTPQERKVVRNAFRMLAYYRNGMLFLFIGGILMGLAIEWWEKSNPVSILLCIAGIACSITGIFYYWMAFRIRAILQWRYSLEKANKQSVHFAFADGIPPWVLGLLVAKAYHN